MWNENKPEMKACSFCGKRVPENEMNALRGRFICSRCLAKQDPSALKEIAREREKQQEAERLEQMRAQALPEDVQLIKLPASHAGELLDTLLLETCEGRPCVTWGVSWRGGFSHADGAGACVQLPDKLAANLTAPLLIGWMKTALPGAVNDLQPLSVYETDPRVIKWCKDVQNWWVGRYGNLHRLN